MFNGAVLFRYDATGLVKFRLYATATSPAALKLVGREVVTADSETEKIEDPESLILNRFPAVPLAPILRENRSPVVVVAEPGDQSIEARVPEVRPVDVEARLSNVPLKLLLASVLRSRSLPVVRDEEVR